MSGSAGPPQFVLTGNQGQDRPTIQAAADYVMDQNNPKEDRLQVVLHFFAEELRRAYNC